MDGTSENNVSVQNQAEKQTFPEVKNAETVPLVKKFPKGKKRETIFLVIGSLLVVSTGIATGWFLSEGLTGGESGAISEESSSRMVQSETEAGLTDESLFPDSSEGSLVEGGINGEGNYHLEREGGPSQNVYLTSTVIDLQSFVGKKVKIWGETLSGQKAGWLMDVGKIKVIE